MNVVIVTLYVVMACVAGMMMFDGVGKRRVDARNSQLEHLKLQLGGTTPTLPADRVIGNRWQRELARGTVSVHFHDGGIKPGARSTQLLLRVPGLTVQRLLIFTQELHHSVSKMMGMQDIEVGRVWFDDAFILQADDPSWLRGVLDDTLQSRLLTLEPERFGPLWVASAGDTLRVHAGAWLDGQDLVTFVRVALELGAKLFPQAAELGATEPALALIEARAPLSPLADCLVCGARLADQAVVRCRSCETPHHAECWKYNGRCAIYGCRS